MIRNFTIPQGYTVRKSETVNDITYIGYSEIGTDDDGAWVVMRLSISGGVSAMEFGEGKWTDRATLTYK